MAGETWGTVAATTDLEENDRQTGPFTGLIREYQRRLDKAVRRNRVRPRNIHASLYFASQIVLLRGLNETA